MTAPIPFTDADLRRAFTEEDPRYDHILGVVRVAADIESLYGLFNGELLQAAYGHDIAHSPLYRVTGFHPVDGWIEAKRRNLSDAVADAILYHSGSWLEARLREEQGEKGLTHYYGDKCRMMDGKLSQALTHCDLHSGPNGEDLTLNQRLADIRKRHAGNSLILQVMETYEHRFRIIDQNWQAFTKPRPASTSVRQAHKNDRLQ